MVMSQRQQQLTITQRTRQQQQQPSNELQQQQQPPPPPVQQQQQQSKWNGEQYRRHRERNGITSASQTKNRMIVVISTFVIISCLVGTIVLVSFLQPTNAFFSDTRRRITAITNGNTTTVYASGKASTSTDSVVRTDATTESVHARSHIGIESTETPVVFGVDVSWPMHHSKVSTNYAWLPHNIDPENNPTPPQYKDMVIQPLGDRQSVYDKFLNDCIAANGRDGSRCKDTEYDRIETIMKQPRGMENYTEIGFKKIKAPPELYSLIQDFWMANKDKGSEEVWSAGNTYTNSWISRSDLISIYDTNLRGGGEGLKDAIHDAARDLISEWTGQELTPCSLYGIRVYHDGAILSPHVDRLPLVSSAIICVDQDLDEPWPLEVIGHDGRAYNVSMEPGDMVLYESHSIIHGRQYPMKGRYMANIFIHFEPTGHSARHNAKIDIDLDQTINAKYREAVNKGHAGHENENSGVPPYILRGSTQELLWKQAHPNGVANAEDKNKQTTGSTQAHHYAREGNVEQLKKVITAKKDMVNVKDVNGFTPLHEGVLGRNLEVVKLLVENGANLNEKTAHGGGTALWWAKHQLNVDGSDETATETDPIIEFLESVGALEVGPEL